MPHLFKRYYPLRDVVFILGESLLILFSMLTALVFFSSEWLEPVWQQWMSQSFLFMVILQLCLYLFELYDLADRRTVTDDIMRFLQAFGLCWMILALCYYLLPTILIAARVFWAGCALTIVVLMAGRSLFYIVLRKGLFSEHVVLLGTGKLACDIVHEVERRYHSSRPIVAFIGREKPAYNPCNRPVLESLDALEAAVGMERLDCIVVAPDDRRGKTPVRELLDYKLAGIDIRGGADFYERLSGKIPVERIDPSFLIFSGGGKLTKLQRMEKRILDLVLATALFVLTLPIMCLTAIIVKLESPGPVFYRQERLGRNAIPFVLVKFRSMRQDAEKDGAVWAQENDPRVTRFGRFIRKTRIDELPQLWNVLWGDMSMVGPRPERKVFVDELVNEVPFYNVRHSVKPGVTGWAQVCYPYGASREDALRKLEFDLYYIKNISIALDILVIFYTVKTVLFGEGGR